jgi:nucleotide-binding universal stress UspA family protein
MAADGDSVLIAYDGSEPARNAIDRAATLFAGRTATVLTVWRSVREVSSAARAALPDGVINDAVRNLDRASEADAAAIAREGAERARTAGLDAEPLTCPADPSVWAAIVAVADEQRVAVVVVGSRGMSGVRSAVLGSVSNALVQHCRQPVVVVHPLDHPV